MNAPLGRLGLCSPSIGQLLLLTRALPRAADLESCTVISVLSNSRISRILPEVFSTSNRVLLLVYYRILEFHEFSPKYASKIHRQPIRSRIFSSRSNRLLSRFVDMRYLPGTPADGPDFTDPAGRSREKLIGSRTPCFFSTGQFDRHSLFPGTCTYADPMLLLFQG